MLQAIKQTQKKPVSLSAVDEKLLLAVYKFHYLTVEQIVRYLCISENSTNWLRTKLKALVEENFLVTQNLPRVSSYGRNFFIYSLAKAGVAHFRELGLEVFDPAEKPGSFLYLEHTLRLNDVLIAAYLLEKQVREVSLAEFRHERVLKHHPTKVQVDKKTVSVIPDAWLDFRLSPPFSRANEQVAVCLELDRATEDIWPFREKIRRYVAFASGAYQADYGTNVLTIAWITTGGQRRVQQMKTWTRDELTKLQAIQFADLFLFTALDIGVVDGLRLFTAPVFHTLSSSGVALLEK